MAETPTQTRFFSCKNMVCDLISRLQTCRWVSQIKAKVVIMDEVLPTSYWNAIKLSQPKIAMKNPPFATYSKFLLQKADISHDIEHICVHFSLLKNLQWRQSPTSDWPGWLQVHNLVRSQTQYGEQLAKLRSFADFGEKWGTWELLAQLLKISVCIIGNWFLSSVKGKPGCIMLYRRCFRFLVFWGSFWIAVVWGAFHWWCGSTIGVP